VCKVGHFSWDAGSGDAMKRYFVTLVFLAACAPIVPDKPGATQSEFNVDQAQCNYCACGIFYRRTGSARPTPACPEPHRDTAVESD
jgi:hypothetical protein